ncbi:substrate-binding domain-containing protein [Danxiaibacter flavus]|uniref:Substrate-binding domain-containing protein n=1 Tax=Danxiaibacter flavus TaxID=3049108 RepID=A0ABV3ZBM5_9BACT|nr:substrate-binding domain-containing protein [Chitinophagaceae bacterium DXS]
MNKKVSLKDIAQKVGVSTALVSYVLNDKRQNRVGKDLAKKIKKTATTLNYRPNQIAKSLKTNKTNTIGLIVADISNPFSSQIARAIEDEAEKNDYTVILGSSGENAEKSAKLINIFLERQVDGIIICPVENTQAQVRYLHKINIPFVLLDRYFPEVKANHVSVNNFGAAYMAVDHLIKQGYRNIGMIAYKTSLVHLQERTRGYIEALRNNKQSFKKSRLKELKMGCTQQEVEKAIDQLLKQPVDALFFTSNTLASCGIKYINKLHIQVPNDLGIVSFDETEAADLFYAPLTYIKQPIDEMGKQSLHILLDKISGKKKMITSNIDGELIVQRSSVLE